MPLSLPPDRIFVPSAATVTNVLIESLTLPDDGKASDGVLITSDNKRIPVIRHVLALRSQYFKKLFFSDFRESSSTQVNVDIPCATLLPALQFAYADDAECVRKVYMCSGVTRKDVMRVLEVAEIADFLGMEDLLLWCCEALRSSCGGAPGALFTVLLAINERPLLLKSLKKQIAINSTDPDTLDLFLARNSTFDGGFNRVEEFTDVMMADFVKLSRNAWPQFSTFQAIWQWTTGKIFDKTPDTNAAENDKRISSDRLLRGKKLISTLDLSELISEEYSVFEKSSLAELWKQRNPRPRTLPAAPDGNMSHVIETMNRLTVSAMQPSPFGERAVSVNSDGLSIPTYDWDYSPTHISAGIASALPNVQIGNSTSHGIATLAPAPTQTPGNSNDARDESSEESSDESRHEDFAYDHSDSSDYGEYTGSLQDLVRDSALRAAAYVPSASSGSGGPSGVHEGDSRTVTHPNPGLVPGGYLGNGFGGHATISDFHDVIGLPVAMNLRVTVDDSVLTNSEELNADEGGNAAPSPTHPDQYASDQSQASLDDHDIAAHIAEMANALEAAEDAFEAGAEAALHDHTEDHEDLAAHTAEMADALEVSQEAFEVEAAAALDAHGDFHTSDFDEEAENNDASAIDDDGLADADDFNESEVYDDCGTGCDDGHVDAGDFEGSEAYDGSVAGDDDGQGDFGDIDAGAESADGGDDGDCDDGADFDDGTDFDDGVDFDDGDDCGDDFDGDVDDYDYGDDDGYDDSDF